MPNPCFCALELVSSNPTRVPPTYTYLGYDCENDVVTYADATRTFDSPKTVAPEGTPMPAVNDPCSCGEGHCHETRPVAEPAASRARVSTASPATPAPSTPCDERFDVDWDVLGQWNARTSRFPDKLLRLVAVGKKEQCCRLKVLMLAYVFDKKCLGDGYDCMLDECDLQFASAPGGRTIVYIGTSGSKKIGPFELQNPPPAP